MSIFNRLLKHALAPVGKIGWELEMWMMKKSCLGHIEGIAICDNSIVQRSPAAFLKATREAMALIKELDHRRYRRICRQFNYIVNKELVEKGNFQPKLKICNVDYSKFLRMTPPRPVRRYASLLIHESTHGVIVEKGILYNKDTRLRIERLCRQEEYRFALNFEPGFAESSVGTFNPEQWKLSWGPQQARTTAVWKRLRESLKQLYFKL